MATKEITIKENGKEMKVFIPGADQMDRHELEDIVQWQEEKTREDLRKTPKVVKPTKEQRKATEEALRDYREFQRRRGGCSKKYY